MLEAARRVGGEAYRTGMESVQKAALHGGKVARVFSFTSGRELGAFERVVFHTVPRFTLPSYLKPIAQWMKPAMAVMGGRTGLAVGAAALSAWLLVELLQSDGDLPQEEESQPLPEGVRSPDDLKPRPVTDDDLRRLAMVLEQNGMSPLAAYLLVRNQYGASMSVATAAPTLSAGELAVASQQSVLAEGLGGIVDDERVDGLADYDRIIDALRGMVGDLKREVSGVPISDTLGAFRVLKYPVTTRHDLLLQIAEDLHQAGYPETADWVSRILERPHGDFLGAAQVYVLLLLEIQAAKLFAMLQAPPPQKKAAMDISKGLRMTDFQLSHVPGFLDTMGQRFAEMVRRGERWGNLIQGIDTYFRYTFGSYIFDRDTFDIDSTHANGKANIGVMLLFEGAVDAAKDDFFGMVDEWLIGEFNPKTGASGPQMTMVMDALEIAGLAGWKKLEDYLSIRMLGILMIPDRESAQAEVRVFAAAHPHVNLRAKLFLWKAKYDQLFWEFIQKDSVLRDLLQDLSIDIMVLHPPYLILLVAAVARGDLSQEEWTDFLQQAKEASSKGPYRGSDGAGQSLLEDPFAAKDLVDDEFLEGITLPERKLPK